MDLILSSELDKFVSSMNPANPTLNHHHFPMQLYSNTHVGTVQSANLHINATNTYNIFFYVQLLHVQKNQLFGVQQLLLVPPSQHTRKPF